LPTEKQQQVLDFVKFLKQEAIVKLESSIPSSRKSYKGLCADLNITITEENIAEAHQEMWGNFPREFPE
jgi:hypothetical protein